MSNSNLLRRRLGSNGPEIGPIAYGCWRFAGTSVDSARTKILAAVDAGMTLIDTADIYGFDGVGGFGDAESLLGEVLASTAGLREQIVLATKGGIRPPAPYDQSVEYLVGACKDSLRRLQVDHVDLYQVHRPDLLTHPAELSRALTEIVNDGLATHVGVSNFTVAQTRALSAHLEFPLLTTQPEFSLSCTDSITDGTLDHAMEQGITPLAWSPLAGGVLGTEAVATDERTVEIHRALDLVAADYGVSRGAAALAWVLAHPSGAVPIIGTQRVDRMAELVAGATIQLERSDWYDLLVASRGEPMP
jgi:hypothetical protein